MPFLDVAPAPELVPLSNSSQALGDADIVGDTSPWPCDHCLCGKPVGANSGCVQSGAQVFAIFTGASSWPHSPSTTLSLVRCNVIEGSPDLPGGFASTGCHPPLPFLPKLSAPRSWEDSLATHCYSGKFWFSPYWCKVML
jgi:hypothetical protein